MKRSGNRTAISSYAELEATATLLKDAKAEMAAAIDARKIENEIMDREDQV